MDIKLTPISFDNRKSYVASIYQAVTKLMSGQDITIKISHQIDLKELAEALDSIEEIVAAAARAMNDKDDSDSDDEDSESDPADWWKPGSN